MKPIEPFFIATNLIFIIQHHLVTSARHSPPYHILVIGVEQIVASQFDVELPDLPADGDMMQGVGVQWERLLVSIRGAAPPCNLKGVAGVPLFPVDIEEEVAVMAWDVNELLATDAL